MSVCVSQTVGQSENKRFCQLTSHGQLNRQSVRQLGTLSASQAGRQSFSYVAWQLTRQLPTHTGTRTNNPENNQTANQ
jgi:hypothetical protein